MLHQRYINATSILEYKRPPLVPFHCMGSFFRIGTPLTGLLFLIPKYLSTFIFIGEIFYPKFYKKGRKVEEQRQRQ